MDENKYYIDRDGLIALVLNISNSIILHTSGEITFTEETDPNTEDTTKSVDNPNNFPTVKAVTDYVENIDFKTINGESIVGNGDIEVSTEEYSLADENTDGLMSKENYTDLNNVKRNVNTINKDISDIKQDLNTIKNTTLPSIEENLTNILQLLNGDENTEGILEIINKYSLILEFINGLGDDDETLDGIIGNILSLLRDVQTLQDDLTELREIVERIGEYDDSALWQVINSLQQSISSLQQSISSLQHDVNELNQEVSFLLGDVRDINEDIEGLDQRVTNLEQRNSLNHVVLTLYEYDNLQEYDEDTLYLILEDEGWGFGDKFPVILT